MEDLNNITATVKGGVEAFYAGRGNSSTRKLVTVPVYDVMLFGAFINITLALVMLECIKYFFENIPGRKICWSIMLGEFTQ